MSILIHPWLILILFLLAPSLTLAQPPEDTWPLARGDERASGTAATTLPADPQLLWEYEVEGGSFESTPVIAAGRVYLGDADGVFYCLDLASGNELWQTPFEDTGFLAPAAVAGERVFVGDYYGNFYCLSTATGELLWTYETGAEINGGPSLHGENVLIGSQDATLYCLSQASGEEVWKYTIGDQIRCLPTMVENRVFIAGCDSILHVIDLTSGEEVAGVPIDGPTGSTPAVLGERLFFGTEGGSFYAIDWQNAEVAWKYGDPERAQPLRAAAAVARLTINDTNEDEARAIAVIGGRSRKVYACDARGGDLLWDFTTGGRVDSSPVIVSDPAGHLRVYIGSSDGRLYGLNLLDGTKEWEFEAGRGFIGSPAIASNRLVIASEDGVVYCLGEE